MANSSLSQKQVGTSRFWFNLLLLLDAFALGGLLVWRLVIDALDAMMPRLTNGEAMGMIQHVEDTFFPYWLGQTGVSLLLLCITAGVLVWLRARQ